MDPYQKVMDPQHWLKRNKIIQKNPISWLLKLKWLSKVEYRYLITKYDEDPSTELKSRFFTRLKDLHDKLSDNVKLKNNVLQH